MKGPHAPSSQVRAGAVERGLHTSALLWKLFRGSAARVQRRRYRENRRESREGTRTAARATVDMLGTVL